MSTPCASLSQQMAIRKFDLFAASYLYLLNEIILNSYSFIYSFSVWALFAPERRFSRKHCKWKFNGEMATNDKSKNPNKTQTAMFCALLENVVFFVSNFPNFPRMSTWATNVLESPQSCPNLSQPTPEKKTDFIPFNRIQCGKTRSRGKHVRIKSSWNRKINGRLSRAHA